jgi:hypothetical protein
MTIARMCQLGRVSRAGFYRFDPHRERPDRDLDLRDEIQRIALEFPCYGRPRITAELRERGWKVNPKRVRRILREDNLLCLRKKKFVATTDSNHNFRVYPNLAGSMELTGLNQLWIADITYIRLETEFVYLAVVLDAYSRRVIGWALDRSLEDDLAIAALQMAFRRRSLSLLVNSGQGAASPTSSEDHKRPCQRIRSAIVFARRPSGPAQAIGRDGKSTPCPSSAMSSGRLFLDRVARQHCPSPLHQHHQLKTIAASNEIIYHRTVTSLLTVCLTAGDKPSFALQR